MKFRRNKYRVSDPAARTWNGVLYASKAEMEFAKHLDTEKRIGIWSDVIRQPIIHLGPIDYRPDFAVRYAERMAMGSEWLWIDVKGTETAEFRLKKKLWRERGPGELRIVKQKGKRFVIAETIVTETPSERK